MMMKGMRTKGDWHSLFEVSAVSFSVPWWHHLNGRGASCPEKPVPLKIHVYSFWSTVYNIIIMIWYMTWYNMLGLYDTIQYYIIPYHAKQQQRYNIHTYIHPFNGPLSGTTRVSRYQKGKTIWILLKQEAVSGSGISWAICKSARRCRQITTPAPHRLVVYRPDALPAAQPTASKHWRHITI